MEDTNKLKCPHCGSILDLSAGAYDGCDWESVCGDGSGFGYRVDLICNTCHHLYPIGRMRREFDFCENVEKCRPYGTKKGREPQ